MARYSNPFVQYLSGTAAVLDGNKLDFFEPGTTTPKNTFSDSGLTTANPNPVVADAAGRIPDIFLDGTYKVVLKDKNDVTIGTADPVGETTAGELQAWLTDVTYNIPDLVKGSDNRFYRSLTNSNQGNDPTTSAANWEQIEFERIFNVNVTYALGDRTIGSDGMEYFSLIAANLNNNPVTDATSTNWRAADQLRSADAGGTVDAITVTYIPAVGALKDELILRVRALGANATTTPTFSPDSLTPKTIVKNGNITLVVGDIKSAGHELLLVFNSTNDNWELLNPASVGANFDLSNLSTTGEERIKKFTSAEQTITTAGSLTIAHGFTTGIPTRITAHLVNKTAEGGYSIGDKLIIHVGQQSSAANNNLGTSVVVDSTNLNVRFGNNSGVFNILNKTTGVQLNITAVNWKIVLEAKI